MITRRGPTGACGPEPVAPVSVEGSGPEALLRAIFLTLAQANAILTESADLLSRIVSKMESIPQGVVELFDNRAVSGTAQQVFDTVEQTEQQWFSCSVYNSGADNVEVRVNDGLPTERASVRDARRGRWQTLRTGESLEVDFHAPLVRFIYYRGASATAAATIKITGEW